MKRHHRVPQHPEGDFEIRLARTTGERIAALRFVQAVYEARSLSDKSCYGARVLPNHLHSDWYIAMAMLNDRIVGSVTFFVDRPSALPSADLEPAIAALPTSIACEISGMSVDHKMSASESLRVFYPLVKYSMEFCDLVLRVDYAVAAMHPDHARYYVEAFNFKVLSEQIRPCPSVNGAAAMFVYLDYSDYRASLQPRACEEPGFATIANYIYNEQPNIWHYPKPASFGAAIVRQSAFK